MCLDSKKVMYLGFFNELPEVYIINSYIWGKEIYTRKTCVDMRTEGG